MIKNKYWNSKGKYQKEYDKLWKSVPDSGECEDEDLEILRINSKLYYDYYNNGFCNLYDCFKRELETFLDFIEIWKEGRKLKELIEENTSTTEYCDCCENEEEEEVEPYFTYRSMTDKEKEEFEDILEKVTDKVIVKVNKIFNTKNEK